MVKTRDVTDEKREKKERAELEKKLIEECFPGKRVALTPINSIFVYNKLSVNSIASKDVGTVVMNVYDKSIFLEAEEFGKRYEEEFHEGKDVFIIETDYS